MSELSQIVQFLCTGVTIGSIYAMVGMGFTMIYNATGIINFAQGEFVMLGGLIMVSLTSSAHIPMPLGFFITVICVMLIGALFERCAIYPLKKPSVLTLIIITLAGSIIAKGVAMLVWGKQTYSLPHFSGDTPLIIAGAAILPQTLWILGILCCVVYGLSLFFNRTMLGKAMRACAVNPIAASLIGINVRYMVLLSFALSAALGAVAGICITPMLLMEFDRGALLGLKGFCAAALGGLGHSGGAVVAGLLIGIFESFGSGYLSSAYKDAIALIVLLAVLLLRPSGLFGSVEQNKLKDF
ncbi:MAG: branched-chain amino acid ABC transporter permease [Desulfobacterota bacterium]|nr:branched-chain amino acid ABC transporter permease [Thermodesulfobacteriota bacterium]